MHEKLLSESSEEKTHWKYLLQSMEKSRVALDACQQLRLSLKQCAGVKDQVVRKVINKVSSRATPLILASDHKPQPVDLLLQIFS